MVDRQAVAIAPPALPSASPADLRGRLWRYRAVRFGAVAASCTLGQLLVLACLTRLGVSEVVANGIGFVLSAQANFILSAQFTWRDRKPRHSRSAWWGRWASFNTVAIVALAVNELVFTMGMRAGSQLFTAAAAGIAAGAALTFALNNLVTFRGQTGRRRPGSGRSAGGGARAGSE